MVAENDSAYPQNKECKQKRRSDRITHYHCTQLTTLLKSQVIKLSFLVALQAQHNQKQESINYTKASKLREHSECLNLLSENTVNEPYLKERRN